MARTKQTARRPCLSKPALEALDKVRKAASDEQYTRARTNAIDSKRKASRRRPRGRQSSLSSSSDTAVEEYPAVAYSSSDPDTETGKKLIAQLRTIAASPQPESPNTIDNYLLSHELTASAYWSRYYHLIKLESSGLNHKGTKNTKEFLRGFCLFMVKFQVIKSAFLRRLGLWFLL